jgi:hypothetical protein
MGDKGAERMSDAEMAFWGWWRAGGEAEFAAEQAPKAEVIESDLEKMLADESEADASAIPEPSTNGKHTTTDAPKTPSGKPSKRGASKAKGGKR